jgi:hypothetical protein
MVPESVGSLYVVVSGRLWGDSHNPPLRTRVNEDAFLVLLRVPTVAITFNARSRLHAIVLNQDVKSQDVKSLEATSSAPLEWRPRSVSRCRGAFNRWWQRKRLVSRQGTPAEERREDNLTWMHRHVGATGLTNYGFTLPRYRSCQNRNYR